MRWRADVQKFIVFCHTRINCTWFCVTEMSVSMCSHISERVSCCCCTVSCAMWQAALTGNSATHSSHHTDCVEFFSFYILYCFNLFLFFEIIFAMWMWRLSLPLFSVSCSCLLMLQYEVISLCCTMYAFISFILQDIFAFTLLKCSRRDTSAEWVGEWQVNDAVWDERSTL